MRVDAYTKAVLTVIAACLMWICLNGVTPVASAQAGQVGQAARVGPTPVMLVDEKGAPIYTSEGFRVSTGIKALPVIVSNPSVPVEISNRPINVAVQSIQRGAAWDPIQVQVMREPPTLMPVP
jgi:hypothetical protein